MGELGGGFERFEGFEGFTGALYFGGEIGRELLFGEEILGDGELLELGGVFTLEFGFRLGFRLGLEFGAF